MFSTRIMGIWEALLSAALFGLIPFFFLPLYANGFSTESSLMFRFFFATLLLVILSVAQKKSFSIVRKDLFFIIGIGTVYYLASLCLFSALTQMPSGIVTTIFFTNPIFIMMLMVIFFKERLEMYKIFFSLTTVFGVALLSGFFDEMSEINTWGIILSTLSGFGYSLYFIGLYTIQDRNISKETISIYLFLTCTLCAFIKAVSSDTFMLADSGHAWFYLVLSGGITVVLPNVLIMSAIKKIGSVLSAILGALEPITAVLIGIVVFNEAFNFSIILGIAVVIVSVIFITILPALRQPTPKIQTENSDNLS